MRVSLRRTFTKEIVIEYGTRGGDPGGRSRTVMRKTKRPRLRWEWWAPVIVPLSIGAFFWVFEPSASSKIIAVGCASAGIAWAIAACPYFTARMPIRLSLGMVVFVALAALSILRLVATVHALVPHHPWDLEYGNIDNSGEKRIYVIARADNTSKGIVTFQQYSKALLKPNPTSIAFLQDPAIIEPLRDEVRRQASGGGNPDITSYPSQEPVTFNILGPVATQKDYDAFRAGEQIVYYDALVYEKLERSGLRFAFEDCEIVRMLPVMQLIPGTGRTVQLPRQSNELPCNKSRF